LNLEAVRHYPFKQIEHRYTFRDTILYALGLGYGSNPVNPVELAFVYELGKQPLKVVPSICCVLAHQPFWISDPAVAVDWVKVLHGEETFKIHHAIPPEGTVIGTCKIIAVEDKGDRGAVVHQLKQLHDKASGELLAEVTTIMIMRGDGGCGTFGTVPPPAPALPETAPAKTLDIGTLQQSALIYRLSGDYNPLHADPATAAKAGFERPILHGLCTLGVATRALIATFAEGQPERLKSMFVRFSRPVFPGETIRTEFFPNGNEIGFRARAVERNVVVLDRCKAVLA